MRPIFFLLAAMHSSMALASPSEISAVLAHPIFAQPYSCTEHWQGNLKGLGDELGTDCVIQELVEVGGRTWMRSYRGDGSRNTDWYGWDKEVLSQCSCEVLKVSENPVSNRPGLMGKPPASFVVLRRDDGVIFLLAHVARLTVKRGDRVDSGQLIAHVGNNGYSRHPHIHVGASRGEEAMQIRFDQASMGKLFEK